MRELHLTDKQVEICDFILRNNGLEDTYGKLEDAEHSDIDNRIASKYLVDNKFITSIHPVVLTDLGSKYSKTGIVKFIRHRRRDEFIESPIVKMITVWIPIVISLILGTINYIQNRENKRNEAEYKSQSELRIINEKSLKDSDSPQDKLAIEKFIKDTTKHIDKDLKINK